MSATQPPEGDQSAGVPPEGAQGVGPSEIRTDVQGHALVIRFHRPHVRNALSDTMLSEAWAAMRSAASNRSILAVVLTGDEQAFCAGGDLKASAGNNLAPFDRYVSRATQSEWSEFIVHLSRFPKPVIAAIEGHCLGGGLEIALQCDLCVGSQTARLGLTEARHGLVPILGGAWSLARCVGPRMAKEMLFTGRRIDAPEALSLGLLNHVVPPGRALTKALEIAAEIARSAPLSVLAAKQAVDCSASQTLDQALATANQWSALLSFSADRREGLDAFRDKREPRFRGE